MNDQTVAGVAEAIAKYHSNSFRIRVFSKYIEPDAELPICVEMTNLAKRLTGDYLALDKYLQISALNQIIVEGSKELDQISLAAAEAEKAAAHLEEAQEVYAEIKAAKKLLEML